MPPFDRAIVESAVEYQHHLLTPTKYVSHGNHGALEALEARLMERETQIRELQRVLTALIGEVFAGNETGFNKFIERVENSGRYI